MGEKKQQERARKFEELVSSALQFADGLGYSSKTTVEHRAVWGALAVFAEKKGFVEMCPELCEQFIRAYDMPDDVVRLPLRYWPERAQTIVRQLMEYSIHGCWKTRRHEAQAPVLPESLADALDEFLLYCRDWKRLSRSTIKFARRYLSDFIRYLHANGVTSWYELPPGNISGFVTSLSHLHPKSIRYIMYSMRSFFRYLFSEGMIPADFSLYLPPIKIPSHQHIPSVWTRDEVDALLAQVDRSSPMGKRDYALLLLACRLGIRAGDIRTLRLEDIDWDKACVTISQNKTGKLLSLPLSEEVGEALIDYLRHGRPSTEHREIFLRINAPIQPFPDGCHFYDIIDRYRRRAGITLPSHQGLHSLRHTVACRLLEADTPFETISDILGHTSQESTRIYGKVDIAALRSAALDPQEVLHA